MASDVERGGSVMTNGFQMVGPPLWRIVLMVKKIFAAARATFFLVVEMIEDNGGIY